MSDHALLSPSSAYRWLNCPLAPRLEEKLPEKPSEFAKEGSLAHKVCEYAAKKRFKKIKAADYTRAIKKLKTDPLWDDEMLHTAEIYVEHLAERAMGFEHEPYLAFEVKVDISDYVPESFGRCDCVMFGGGTLIITDYKHGKGISVNAAENPQLMLYALGALKLYRTLFGNTIQNIEVCIDQPRLNSYATWSCKTGELLDWGAGIKPRAQQAFMGVGEYLAGDWCRFCRANGICKAQAKQQTSAFDDFAGAVGQPAALLSPTEMGAVLEKGKTLVEWYEAVKKCALDTILSGTEVPGWKAVEGRNLWTWTDQDKALETLEASGIERAVLYDNVPKSLAQLKKMLGTAKFNELVGGFAIKPPGKPALADAADKRKEYNSAATDFASVVAENS